MIKIQDKSACCGCHACAAACPKNCIRMVHDEEGFLYPVVDQESCISCGLCEKSCPILNSQNMQPDKEPEAYAAINNNEAIRLESSSGGIFDLLAKAIIEEEGIVFGAAMSKDCRSVRHIAVETEEELWKLRGSKYVQSAMGDVYKIVQTQLEIGRKVLFTGTPCQVEGLKSYLRKEYDNLLCVDLICHGVPSPKVWNKYVSFREERAGSSPTLRTFFRNKKYGWKTYAVVFEFLNQTVYEQIMSKDLYMQAFLGNACLRPSCHTCRFKTVGRVSDITLADFWGVKKVIPQMYDNKGTSLVLIQSENGRKTFESLTQHIRKEQVGLKKVFRLNSAIVKPARAHKHRKDFLANLEVLPFDELVRKYAKPRWALLGLIVSILRKIGIYETLKKLLRR